MKTISVVSILFPIGIYVICGNIFLSLGIGGILCCWMIFLTNQRDKFDMFITRPRRFSNELLRYYPIFHIISLFSSSFIEEEHQCWYYFLSSYFLLKTIEEISWKNFFFLILSRFIRSWNQTGNKWLHLHDIADFFNT